MNTFMVLCLRMLTRMIELVADLLVTNAYTEALNGLLRQVARTGRGYSFQTIRSKLLLTQGFQAHRQPPYRKQIRGSPMSPNESSKQVLLIFAIHPGYCYKIAASNQ